MESLNLNVRVDANDKKEFEKFCSRVGMNVSVAVNLFIKAVLREQRLPFEIKTNTYEENTYQKLKEAEEEMDSNPKRYKEEEVLKGIDDIIG